MKPSSAPLVTRDDYYALTERGEAEIRGARTTVPSIALEVLVRMDGPTSIAQLQAGMPDTPFEQIAATVGLLLRDRYIRYAEAAPDSHALRFDAGQGFAWAHDSAAAAAARMQSEATAGAKSLEHQGYYVRITRRPAASPTLPADRRPHAVVVEDEPHLAKFLKHFLTFEGFEVRIGGDKAGIAQALREQPRPDLVLLDVVLPDTNGFEVLTAIRRHSALRDVPVMMLTAESTRQSVLRGLACGADGYITKPFHTDVLLNAIRTVFGLTHARTCPWEYA